MAVTERALLIPASAAAPRANVLDATEQLEVATRLALDMEGARRSRSLGGGLLLIPASAAAVTGTCAMLGAPAVWLPVFALVGCAIGPALTTAVVAGSTALGVPVLKRRHRRRCRSLGLCEVRARQGWDNAARVLDERTRLRLGRKHGEGHERRARPSQG